MAKLSFDAYEKSKELKRQIIEMLEFLSEEAKIELQKLEEELSEIMARRAQIADEAKKAVLKLSTGLQTGIGMPRHAVNAKIAPFDALNRWDGGVMGFYEIQNAIDEAKSKVDKAFQVSDG